MSKLPTVLVIFLLLSLFFTGAASAVSKPLSEQPEQSAYTTIEIIIIIALIFIGIVALGYALHKRRKE